MFLLWYWGAPQVLVAILLTALGYMIGLALITLFWKISFHSTAISAAASVGIMRETCRDLNVPFVHLGLDLFDKRYSTPDQVKDKMSQFFRAMGLG